MAIFSRNFKLTFEHGNSHVCLPKANKSILLQETFLNVGGGVIQECFSNVSNNRFFKLGHFQKTLLVKKNYISNINLSQKIYLNFDEFGIGNNVPDCLSALFTY